jgi:hypothetical protein
MAKKIQFSPHEHLRAGLLKRLGLHDTKKIPPLDQLRWMQWDDTFERGMLASLKRVEWIGDKIPSVAVAEMIQLMKNRFIQGAFRYTPLPDQVAVKTDYDQCGEIMRRYSNYAATLNSEMLVDAANFCLSSHKVGWYPQLSNKESLGVLDDLDRDDFSGSCLDGLNWAINTEWTRYKETGSRFSLYDVAAMLALEWEFGDRPGRIFHSHDGDGAMHMETV